MNSYLFRTASQMAVVLSLSILSGIPSAKATPAVTNVSSGEMEGMRKLFAVDDDQFDFNDAYTVDNLATILPGSFSRVAYYVELGPIGDTKWVWVSMDAFKTNAALLGVPKAGTGIVENGTVVSNLKVETNHPNVTAGGYSAGIIEFWASNYNANGGGLFGSNNSLFDWKDSGGSTGGGHGSFQAFAFTNPGMTAATTLFGITANGGAGIGDQPTGEPDWTFGPGTGSYAIRNMEIWVDSIAGLSVGDASVAEVDAGTSQLVFDVTLSKGSATSFTVDYTVTGVTATVGDGDISGPLTGTLNFAGTTGEVRQISIDVQGDTKVELNETVTAVLGNLQTSGGRVAGLAGGAGGVFANVPEAAGYTLVYDLAIPNSAALVNGTPVSYTTDNSEGITTEFDRIAYYMELDNGSGPQWVYASVDAFTSDASQIGLPHNVNNPVKFQQIVDNMNVASNMPGIVTGSGIATGNIEFWSTNYTGVNDIGIPGANGGTFDFGDGGAGIGIGYGSFQIHNHGAAQTLFAYNRWGGGLGGNSDLGIGSAPSGSPDYTFAQNAATYTVKNLQILVRPKVVTGTIVNDDSATVTIGDVSTAEGDAGTAQLVFDVTLDNQVDVPVTVDFTTLEDTATVADNDYTAQAGSLDFSGAAGETLQITVDVNGDCDLEADEQMKVILSNLQASGRDVTLGGTGFAPGGAEAVFANVPEANGYELAYDLTLNNALDWDTTVPYTTNNSGSIASGSFDRIAYYLELDGNYVFVSVDAFTNNAALIGVPGSAGSNTVFQQLLTNMNVVSNVPGVVTGTGITTGNIEFWKFNYGTNNVNSVPGANSGAYDFGDEISPGNHGSMQIHNYGAGQTLFAVNNFNVSVPGSIGIGNAPSSHTDWTFSSATYANKQLQILVRTGITTGVTATGVIGNDDFAPEVTLPGIADTTILTSAPQAMVSLFPHFQDADEADNVLVYTVSGNTNPALIQTSSIDSADGILVLDTPCTLKGAADITVTVTDPCGHSVSDTFTVTVEDNVAPVLEVKDIVLTISSALTEVAVDPFTFSAVDKVDGTLAVNYSPDTSSPFPVGVTPVAASAMDSSGNMVMATFNVVILHEHPTPGPRYLDVVSLRGDAASGPGVPAGATIFNINKAYLNNNGSILFDAALSGAGTANVGLFSGPVGGPLTAVAVKGASAPGGGVFGAFSNLALNDTDTLSFQSSSGSSPAQYFDGALAAIKGGLAPTGGGEEYVVLQKPALASDGSLLVVGNLRLGSGAGVTVNSDTLIASGNSTLLAREGSASSVPATDYGQIHPRVVASEDNARYAFTAYLIETVFDPSDNTALFTGLVGGGAPQAIVREGDPAAGGGGANFFSFLGEAVNSTGEIVLRANLSGGGITTLNNEGLWTNSGNTGAPPVLIAREGDVAPCLPHSLAAFSRFSTFFMGDDGSVCFLAFLKNATASPVIHSGNDGSLWRWKDGQLHLIAREGDDANNTSGSVIRSIGNFAYSGSGAVAFDVSLVTGIGDTTSTTNLAVYLDRGAMDPVPQLVLRRSDTFVLDEITYLVAGIKLSVESNSGGGTGGYGRAINDAGEIILNLTLSNNKSGIFVLGMPPL
jgi:hypothetical protein